MGKASGILKTAGAGGGGWAVLTIAANAVTPVMSVTCQKLILNQAAQVTVNNPTGSIGAGLPFKLYVIQDATGGRPTMLWGTAFGQDVATQVLFGTPNTRSAYVMTFQDDSKWHLDSFITGQPLS
jgi:hypothetical protein